LLFPCRGTWTNKWVPKPKRGLFAKKYVSNNVKSIAATSWVDQHSSRGGIHWWELYYLYNYPSLRYLRIPTSKLHLLICLLLSIQIPMPPPLHWMRRGSAFEQVKQVTINDCLIIMKYIQGRNQVG